MKKKCYIVVANHLENKSRDKMEIKMEKSMNTETEKHMMNDKNKTIFELVFIYLWP